MMPPQQLDHEQTAHLSGGAPLDQFSMRYTSAYAPGVGGSFTYPLPPQLGGGFDPRFAAAAAQSVAPPLGPQSANAAAQQWVPTPSFGGDPALAAFAAESAYRAERSAERLRETMERFAVASTSGSGGGATALSTDSLLQPDPSPPATPRATQTARVEMGTSAMPNAAAAAAFAVAADATAAAAAALIPVHAAAARGVGVDMVTQTSPRTAAATAPQPFAPLLSTADQRRAQYRKQAAASAPPPERQEDPLLRAAAPTMTSRAMQTMTPPQTPLPPLSVAPAVAAPPRPTMSDSAMQTSPLSRGAAAPPSVAAAAAPLLAPGGVHGGTQTEVAPPGAGAEVAAEAAMAVAAAAAAPAILAAAVRELAAMAAAAARELPAAEDAPTSSPTVVAQPAVDDQDGASAPALPLPLADAEREPLPEAEIVPVVAPASFASADDDAPVEEEEEEAGTETEAEAAEAEAMTLEPTPSPEPTPTASQRLRRADRDGLLYSQQQFIDHYGGTEEGDSAAALVNLSELPYASVVDMQMFRPPPSPPGAFTVHTVEGGGGSSGVGSAIGMGERRTVTQTVLTTTETQTEADEAAPDAAAPSPRPAGTPRGTQTATAPARAPAAAAAAAVMPPTPTADGVTQTAAARQCSVANASTSPLLMATSSSRGGGGGGGESSSSATPSMCDTASSPIMFSDGAAAGSGRGTTAFRADPVAEKSGTPRGTQTAPRAERTTNDVQTQAESSLSAVTEDAVAASASASSAAPTTPTRVVKTPRGMQTSPPHWLQQSEQQQSREGGSFALALLRMQQRSWQRSAMTPRATQTEQRFGGARATRSAPASIEPIAAGTGADASADASAEAERATAPRTRLFPSPTRVAPPRSPSPLEDVPVVMMPPSDLMKLVEERTATYDVAPRVMSLEEAAHASALQEVVNGVPVGASPRTKSKLARLAHTYTATNAQLRVVRDGEDETAVACVVAASAAAAAHAEAAAAANAAAAAIAEGVEAMCGAAARADAVAAAAAAGAESESVAAECTVAKATIAAAGDDALAAARDAAAAAEEAAAYAANAAAEAALVEAVQLAAAEAEEAREEAAAIAAAAAAEAAANTERALAETNRAVLAESIALSMTASRMVTTALSAALAVARKKVKAHEDAEQGAALALACFNAACAARDAARTANSNAISARWSFGIASASELAEAIENAVAAAHSAAADASYAAELIAATADAAHFQLLSAATEASMVAAAASYAGANAARESEFAVHEVEAANAAHSASIQATTATAIGHWTRAVDARAAEERVVELASIREKLVLAEEMLTRRAVSAAEIASVLSAAEHVANDLAVEEAEIVSRSRSASPMSPTASVERTPRPPAAVVLPVASPPALISTSRAADFDAESGAESDGASAVSPQHVDSRAITPPPLTASRDAPPTIDARDEGVSVIVRAADVIEYEPYSPARDNAVNKFLKLHGLDQLQLEALYRHRRDILSGTVETTQKQKKKMVAAQANQITRSLHEMKAMRAMIADETQQESDGILHRLDTAHRAKQQVVQVRTRVQVCHTRIFHSFSRNFLSPSHPRFPHHHLSPGRTRRAHFIHRFCESIRSEARD